MSDQAPEAAVTEHADSGIDLRGLLKQRVEHKLRRIHKQWFCLDPQIQSDLDEALAALAELIGREVQLQQLRPSPPSKKYGLPTDVQRAELRVTELRARSRQVGVMGVFSNLTDAQLDDALSIKDPFTKAKMILTESFLRWEDADGNPFPVDEYVVSGSDMRAVEMIPGYTHSITNLSDTEDLVTVMWANEPFDPENPDTYYEEV